MHWTKFIILLLLGVFLSCARIVMPTGGPADTSPPVAEESKPENFSTQFYDDKIVIKFDEYIVLKSFNDEFVSSPLFKDKPKKILKGKSLILKFDKDSLEKNTSYTLDFGQSIVGYRAGNVLQNFQYVFSTGDYIDSLSISGHLFGAEDLSPQEKVWVMLYKEYNDSILKTQKPNFVAKTNPEGYYQINNIAPGKYAIFALKDINNNFIFDLPNEQIAFLDSVFILKMVKEEQVNIDSTLFSADSVMNKLDTAFSQNLDSTSVEWVQDSLLNGDHLINPDSLLDFALSIKTDSVIYQDSVISEDNYLYADSLDSIANQVKYKIYPEHIDLYLFEEEFSNLYINDYKRVNQYLINITFSQSFDSVLTIHFDKETSGNQWIMEPSANRDTFNIWLIDTNLAHQDSLTMYLDFYKTDTLLNLVPAKDTIDFNFVKKEVYKGNKQKRKEDRDVPKADKNFLKISGNFESGTLDFYKQPRINISFPLDSVNLSKIHFYEKEDSLFNELNISVIRDSLNYRSFIIDTTLQEDKGYKVFIEPDAFVDYRNWGNDTLEREFKSTKLDIYTEILLKVEGVEEQTVIQLYNPSNRLVRESVITSDTSLTFKYLKPVKYKLKMIEDKNKNSKWDTGNYELNIQPEKINYFPDEMPTKANWTHEFIWNLNKNEEEKEHIEL